MTAHTPGPCDGCAALKQENERLCYLVECGLSDLNDGNYGLAREWFQKVPSYEKATEAKPCPIE